MTTYQDLDLAAAKGLESFIITQKQYDQGYVGQTACIESERNLNQSLEEKIKAKEALLLDLIVLYRSLGGGFEPFPSKSLKVQ